jgi:two-component sensor histidine kinase
MFPTAVSDRADRTLLSMARVLRQGRRANSRTLMVGLASACGAVALRYALIPLMGDSGALVTTLPAVLLATIFGGAAGGLSCLLIALLGAWYLFLGVRFSFAFAAHEPAVLLASLTAGAIVIGASMLLRELIFRLEAAKEREHLLVLELQHRVKNNLAVVQAVAAQTLRSAPDLAAFRTAFAERLAALGCAHNLLSRGSGEIVGLEELVEQTLAPFEGLAAIVVQGTPVTIRAQQAVSIVLCLHELATNAAKYGALSQSAGTVEIRWLGHFDGDHLEVVLNWTERGGPPVSAPSRRGFGSRLLTKGVDPGHSAKVSFEPHGLSWSVSFRAMSLDEKRRAHERSA